MRQEALMVVKVEAPASAKQAGVLHIVRGVYFRTSQSSEKRSPIWGVLFLVEFLGNKAIAIRSDGVTSYLKPRQGLGFTVYSISFLALLSPLETRKTCLFPQNPDCDT